MKIGDTVEILHHLVRCKGFVINPIGSDKYVIDTVKNKLVPIHLIDKDLIKMTRMVLFDKTNKILSNWTE